MSQGDIFWLLVICGIAAVIGFAGTGYGGAHLWAIFTALALLGAWTQGVEIVWISHLAPVAFAYGAAHLRIAKDRGDF